jgi:hypothetical protein
MYTPVVVRVAGGAAGEGHVYDISEGGVRFELDQAIAPGTPVEIAIMLPGPSAEQDRSVAVSGHVVWALVDPDEPGPVRMAAAFTRFAAAADRERLVMQLARQVYARAA